MKPQAYHCVGALVLRGFIALVPSTRGLIVEYRVTHALHCRRSLVIMLD